MRLKITNTRLHLHLTEANGLNAYYIWSTVINTNYSRSDVNRNIKTSKQTLCKHLEDFKKLSTFCRRYLFAMLNYWKNNSHYIFLKNSYICGHFFEILFLFRPVQPHAITILPTYRFVTDLCTCVHISVTKWCIVGYLSNALWDLLDLWDLWWVYSLNAEKADMCLWTRVSLVQLMDQTFQNKPSEIWINI